MGLRGVNNLDGLIMLNALSIFKNSGIDELRRLYPKEAPYFEGKYALSYDELKQAINKEFFGRTSSGDTGPK
jgi:hypothetical protein